jgi:hypothetical protein
LWPKAAFVVSDLFNGQAVGNPKWYGQSKPRKVPSNEQFATLFITTLVPFIAAACTAVDDGARSNTTTQLEDAAYCQALTDRYMTHVGTVDGLQGRNSEVDPLTALDLNVAIAQCRGGNRGPAIAVLELKLRDSGVKLPSRITHVGRHPVRP